MDLGGGGRAFLLFSLQAAGDSQAAFHAAKQPTDLFLLFCSAGKLIPIVRPKPDILPIFLFHVREGLEGNCTMHDSPSLGLVACLLGSV